jgi:hypothetical protein
MITNLWWPDSILVLLAGPRPDTDPPLAVEACELTASTTQFQYIHFSGLKITGKQRVFII